MSEDARQRTKLWFEDYVNPDAFTFDDGVTTAHYIVTFGFPDYPIVKVFRDPKNIDLVFSIGTPDSIALPVGVGYLENVPITVTCIDKTGITGTKLRWKAEAELRRVVETYPTGSLRTLERLSDNEERIGATVFYSVNYTLKYKRYA